MSEPLQITGWGAVSPAGWQAGALCDAVLAGIPLPFTLARREESAPERRIRKAPPLAATPDWMKQPRLRRTTASARHAVHAAMEALGPDNLARVRAGEMRTGTLFCTMSGCVQFSRRFYAEVLDNPLLASPILFPETVYNAPASHISSLLGCPEANYTLVGDSAQFLGAMDLAAQWLDDDMVDACLVVAAEELDWVSEEALLLFDRESISAEGAAAILLQRRDAVPGPSGGIRLASITEAFTYGRGMTREAAARRLRDALAPAGGSGAILCDGRGSGSGWEHAERAAWSDWAGPTASVRAVLGEAFAVTSGWQTVLACELLRRGHAARAIISAVGLTQQAMGAVLGNDEF